jgi:hypothetical protein
MLGIAEGDVDAPSPGQRTNRARVLSVETGERRIRVTVEGLAGGWAEYWVRQPDRVMPKIEVSDGLSSNANAGQPGVALSFADSWEKSHGAPLNMEVHFPPGEGWKTITVTLTW